VVLVALGVVLLLLGGVVAFVTRPVSDAHDAVLKASAAAVVASLEAGRAGDYGGGHKPGQAFCAHFPTLGKHLADWDQAVAAPSGLEHALDVFIDSMMYEREMTGLELDVAYNVIEIKKYGHGLAMARARGVVKEPPQIEWAGYSTAGGHVPGPPEGKLKPNGSIADWISLEPLDGETADEWSDRAGAYTQRVDAFVAAVYADMWTHAQAAVTAEQHFEDFKRDKLPAILDALQLVQEREAPRMRHGCDSC